MEYQLILNPEVPLGPANGPYEPLPPNPPVNADPLGEFIDSMSENSKMWYLSKGDSYLVQHCIGRLRTPSVGNVHGPGLLTCGDTHLPPVQRNTYHEHFRTVRRSADEVQEYRKKNGITIVNGRRVPKPLLHTYEVNFPACLAVALEANIYPSSPTPTQAQCWPIALEGRDLLGVLESGAKGKTLAYILPTIVHVLQQPHQEHRHGFMALVLTPTTEDAREIQRVVSEFETYTRVRAKCVCSGDPKDRQLSDLTCGFDICVTTPGRLHTLIKEDKLDIGRCRYLVLEEADRMVDMGFELQPMRIAGSTRPDRQSILWMSRRPRHLYRLFDALLKNYVEIHIGMCPASPDQSVQPVVLVTAEAEKEAKLGGL